MIFLWGTQFLCAFENASIKGPDKLCSGDTAILRAEPKGSRYQYEWSNGETADSIVITRGGSYYVIVKEGKISTSIAYQNVIEFEKPEILILTKGQSSICEGDTLELKAIGISSVYSWQMHYKEDFDTRKSYPEWTSSVRNFKWQNPVKVDSNIKPYKKFLGPFGNQDLTLSLARLPAHDSVEVSFEFLAIGTWDGNRVGKNGPDIFRIEDSQIKKEVYQTTFSLIDDSWQSFPDTFPTGSNPPRTGSSEDFVLTTSTIYGSSSKFKVNVRFGHFDDSLKLKILSLMKDEVPMLTNESWALDNFSIALRTKYTDSVNLKYQWSTGDTSQLIYAAQGAVYKVIAENEGGCTDSAEIKINVFPKPEVHILGKQVMCSSEFITLTADRDFASYFWSSSEKTKSIRINSPGFYNLVVTDSNGCTAEETIEVKLNWLKPAKIVADSFLCKNGEVLLKTEDEFVSYLWSTGETGKEIKVNKSGTYSVFTLDSNGCTSEAFFVLRDFDYSFSYPLEYDFGKVPIGGEPSSFFQLKNTNISPMYINNIGFSSGTDFFVESVTAPPFLFDTNQVVDLNVTFKPKLKGIYYDTLLIDIETPCIWHLRIPIKGLGVKSDSFIVTLNLPDTSAVIGTKDYGFYLTGSVNSKTSFRDLIYNAEIAFDADYFYPENAEYGSIVESKVEGNERLVRISGIIPLLDDRNIKILGLRGLVLIGRKETIPLKINSFTLNDSNVYVNKNDGSLSVNGVCGQNISSIKLFKPASLQVIPNPVREKGYFSFISDTDGICTVGIYNVNGEKLLYHSINAIKSKEYTLPLELNDISTGLFLIILKTPASSLKKQFLFIPD